MPHFDRIQVPGKYWKKQHVDTNGRSPGTKEFIPVYVMQKDHLTKKVLASIGGLPAEWVPVSLSGRWITTQQKKIEEARQPKQL